MTRQAAPDTPDQLPGGHGHVQGTQRALHAAAAGRRRTLPATVVVVLALLVSTVVSAIFSSTSMVWRASPDSSVGVAVNPAVNVHSRGSFSYSDYRVVAGHSHGPPTNINAQFCGVQTYYVLAGNTPVLVHNCGTTDIFRTSPAERGSSELDNGLNPDHFPGSPGSNPDGSAHFGNNLTATEWAQNHGDTHGVGFSVKVPNDWLNGHISAGRIDVYDGLTEDHLEYIIPKGLFGEFNQFPRFPWSGR